MRIGENTTMTVSGLFTPAATAFMGSTVEMMIPWLLAMMMAVVVDLIAGIRKSLLLGVRVSPSSAFRATMGKIVVYVAFVLMVCMLDVAARGSGVIAKWCCLFIAGLELGSVASNLLKPYGIDMTMKGIVRLLLNRSPLRVDDREADVLLNEQRREEMAGEERRKWGRKGGGRTRADKDAKGNNDNNDNEKEEEDGEQ